MPMKKLSITLCAVLGAATVFLNMPVEGAGAALTQQSSDFRAVAKKAIPSVVSVKVRGKLTGRSDGDDEEGYAGQDPFDLFGDSLLQRFFGSPYQRRQQQSLPQQQAQASGFLVSADGYILTNNHVIRDADEITITLNDGREYTAKVIGQDANTDVAVIKIDEKNLPYLSLGNSDELEVGQWVVAIGNPLGLQASLTAGVVSAKGRNNLDLARIEDFIQTDAAINRGNSGGPLLDLEGNVIGMNTAIVSSMGNGGGYMGIGFAIPSNMAHSIMEQIIKDGVVTRGYLGMTMQQIDKDLAQGFGLSKAEGALITEVVKGSPAEKAGLQQGDIILKLNNAPFANIASLRNSIALTKPGKKAVLTVLRDGKTLSLPVEIGLFPTAKTQAVQVSDKFGFQVEALTPELAKQNSYSEEKGVVISKVVAGSAASWAGLRRGALLMAVNRQPIASIDDYNKAMAELDASKPVVFLIKQGGSVRYLSLRLP